MHFTIRINGHEKFMSNDTGKEWRTDAMYTALLVAGRLAAIPYMYGYNFRDIHQVEILKHGEDGVSWIRMVYDTRDEREE